MQPTPALETWLTRELRRGDCFWHRAVNLHRLLRAGSGLLHHPSRRAALQLVIDPVYTLVIPLN